MRAPLRLLLAALALAAAPGCSSPCVDVQELICLCQGQTQDERNTCKSNAQNQEELTPPDETLIAWCEANYDACAALIADGEGCARLQTAEGRKVCGLAHEP